MTNDLPRLTDKIGLVALDGADYGEKETRQTTIAVDVLQDSLELLDTLGWKQVDVITVEGDESTDNPMLLFRPPHESLISGDQAAISLAPRTDKGRKND